MCGRVHVRAYEWVSACAWVCTCDAIAWLARESSYGVSISKTHQGCKLKSQ